MTQLDLVDVGRPAPIVYALTVCQPWAWAIVAGHKRVENRIWSTNYRGRIYVHAGARRGYREEGRDLIERLGLPLPAADDLPYGALIGTVELVDVVPVELVARDPFAAGPFCWLLKDARPLARPIVCTGRQKLWRLSPDILG